MPPPRLVRLGLALTVAAAALLLARAVRSTLDAALDGRQTVAHSAAFTLPDSLAQSLPSMPTDTSLPSQLQTSAVPSSFASSDAEALPPGYFHHAIDATPVLLPGTITFQRFIHARQVCIIGFGMPLTPFPVDALSLVSRQLL